MDFATLEENASNYFASMSHLASKMIQYNESVKDMYRDTWDGLSWEKQEELIDRHIIDPKVVGKYSSYRKTEEPPNCFPVLKINSGEKIVVDFEHDDGWTWTDEHSAPFSWKTKSQQDLTLADVDDSTSSKDELNKKGRLGKKSRSPDRIMFDSAAINGDRSKNEVEKMFEKFGIKVPGFSDEEGEEKIQEPPTSEVVTRDPDSTASPSHLYNEHSKLLGDSSDALDTKDFVFDSSVGVFYPTEIVKRSTSKQETATAKTKESKTKKQGGERKDSQGKGVKEKANKKKKVSTAAADRPVKSQQSSVDMMTLDYDTSSQPNFDVSVSYSQPNVLEVRFPEIGESSTDDFQENHTNTSSASLVSEAPEHVSRRNNVFDLGEPEDQRAVITSQPKKFETSFDAAPPYPPASSEPVDVKSESIVRTGFDFLDNW